MNYGIRSLFVANDTLYGFQDTSLWELEAHPTDVLTMQYISPKYIGAGYTVPKTYKNFYMRSEGEVTIRIYIDDVLVQEAVYTTKDTHQVKIPQNNTRGFDIFIQVFGEGTVYELLWDEGDANQ